MSIYREEQRKVSLRINLTRARSKKERKRGERESTNESAGLFGERARAHERRKKRERMRVKKMEIVRMVGGDYMESSDGGMRGDILSLSFSSCWVT